jgi:hypothetical protein
MILRSSKQTSPPIKLEIQEKTTKKKALKKKNRLINMHKYWQKRFKLKKKNRLILICQ